MARISSESTESDIGALVRELETNYVSGTTTSSRHVHKSMKDDLDRIDAYVNSKHISGPTDSQGREKPFFNIVTAAKNIWYRATDIDRKNITISPKEVKHTMLAFLASIHVQDFFDKDNFGKFLNKWGLTLATYGSAVSKFIVKDGELHADVVAWNRLIVDPISFYDNPVIEVIELTEAQLYKRQGYDRDMVEKLCDAAQARRTIAGDVKDRKNDYIKVYEVHGELPLSYLTGKEKDEDIYVQQMHVISFLARKDGATFDDFTLYSGREENPYMITHLIEEDGQTLSIGSVQNLFEAQWMLNHTAKSIKDQLDLASKLIFQSADTNFVNQNALTAIENGDILIHAPNMPVTQVQNNSHDITALQNQSTSWKAQANEINGISEAMLGINPASHTAWRQTNAVLEESHSLFEIMTENKGLAIEDMMRKFVIPFIRKYKLNDAKQIAATLSLHNINKVDSAYISNQATRIVNAHLANEVLKYLHGEAPAPTPEQQAVLMQKTAGGIQKDLSQLGDWRFFAPDEVDWKTEFKDLEWNVRVDVTGENSLGKEDLQTLTTVLQTIANNPRVLTDPNAKLVFNKILTITGAVSPVELTDSQPYVPMPSRRFTEAMDYVDVPDDIKRQMEAQAGFQPSQQQTAAPAGIGR